MIPSFSIMGINSEFEDMAKKVQEYASTQQQTKGIPEMVLQLENVCVQACEELKEELNAIKNAKNERKKLGFDTPEDNLQYIAHKEFGDII